MDKFKYILKDVEFQMEIGDIVFSTSEIFDFAGCMERVSLGDAFYKNMNKSSLPLHIDEDAANWVCSSIDSLNPDMAECFDFFFNRQMPFGRGVLKLSKDNNINSIDDLFTALENMDCSEMIIYFINNDENLISLDDIGHIRESQSFAYKFIENTFTVSRENKWRILSLINDSETYKQKFLKFIKEFYKKYYEEIKEKAANIIRSKSPEIINYILHDPVSSIKGLTLLDINSETNLKLWIGFSYFIDLGVMVVHGTHPNTYIAAMGTRHLEKFLSPGVDYLNDDDMVNICSVIGDKTRLGILKMLRDGPVYGSEIAEKFGISNPAASYHLEQFMAGGLVTIKKEGHRVYYCLKDNRIVQIINYLENFAIS